MAALLRRRVSWKEFCKIKQHVSCVNDVTGVRQVSLGMLHTLRDCGGPVLSSCIDNKLLMMWQGQILWIVYLIHVVWLQTAPEKHFRRFKLICLTFWTAQVAVFSQYKLRTVSNRNGKFIRKIIAKYSQPKTKLVLNTKHEKMLS